MLLALGCGDDAPATKAAPAEDPCVAIRAEYFRRERSSAEWSAVWGTAGNAPFSSSAALDRYKLDHPKCFF
jgi:hypothetical protein